MRLVDWLTHAKKVALGHAKSPVLPPIERLELISEAILKPAECQQIQQILVYVVSSELERHLLIELARCNTLAALLRENRLQIHSYESVLRLLRGHECPVWKQELTTFVCQFDGFFSASFALAIIELMRAARPSSCPARTYRLLSLGQSDVPHESLMMALQAMSPGHEGFIPVALIENPKHLIAATYLPHEELEDTLAKTCENITSQTILIFCTQLVADTLSQKLPADVIQLFNDMSYLEQIKQELIRNKNPSRGKVLFMTGTDDVPIPLPHVSTILVESAADIDLWERGRILSQRQPISRYEFERAVSYRLQCLKDQVDVFVPIREVFQDRDMPHRRLDNAQVWGFCADLMLHFQDVLSNDLMDCFILNPDAVFYVLRYFEAIGFTIYHPNSHGRLVAVPETARDMSALLDFLGHDFFLARFLSVGMKDPNATVAAKRAMIRIAAIAKSKWRIFDCVKLMAKRAADKNGPTSLGRDLAGRVAPYFSMPNDLYLEGIVWVSLAVWHTAQCTTTPELVASTDARALEWPEVDDLVVNLPWSRITAQTVTWLNEKFSIDRQPGATIAPLHLSPDDCRVIHIALVNSWLQKSFVIQIYPNADQLEEIVVGDPVSTTIGQIVPSNRETFCDWATVGTPGGSGRTWKIIAALECEIHVRSVIMAVV